MSLPNITLGIPVWYINLPTNTTPNQLKPYTSFTPVQHVVPTPTFVVAPQQPQQEVTPILKAPPTTPTPSELPKPIPPCVLCDVVGHTTNNFPEVPHLKDVVFDTFLDSNVPRSMSPYFS